MIKLNKSSFIISLFASCLLGSSFSQANPLAIEAFENNDLTTAKGLFEENIKKNPKDFVSLDYLANIALRQDEYDDAEEYIEKALNLAAMDAKIQFDAGKIMGAQAQDSSIFSAMGYAKKSLQAFKQAAQLEPDNIKYRQALMSFYLQAPGIAGGDVALAEAEANAIETLDPAKGFMAMASIYQKTDEVKLTAHYAKLEQQFPDNAAVLFNRAMYFQSKEKFDLAITDFRKILTIKPTDEEDNSLYAALYQLGRTSLLSNDNIEEGIQSLQSFIETAPTHDSLPSKAWAKYRLGLLYVSQGDKKTAKELYQQAKNETKDETLLKNIKKSLKNV